MMDLTYEASNGIYLAPIQMQANNGLLVIDDFGRQTVSPEALLNRWIVPLDRRLDYLSLSYGVRFDIPFDVKVVFSTNLDPATLGDEAFYRRIQNKILVSSISDAEFDEVLFRSADGGRHHASPPAPTSYLRQVSRDLGDGDLRPYLPKEVCKILRAVCTYNRTPLVLDQRRRRPGRLDLLHPGRRDPGHDGRGHPGRPAVGPDADPQRAAPGRLHPGHAPRRRGLIRLISPISLISPI